MVEHILINLKKFCLDREGNPFKYFKIKVTTIFLGTHVSNVYEFMMQVGVLTNMTQEALRALGIVQGVIDTLTLSIDELKKKLSDEVFFLLLIHLNKLMTVLLLLLMVL